MFFKKKNADISSQDETWDSPTVDELSNNSYVRVYTMFLLTINHDIKVLQQI